MFKWPNNEKKVSIMAKRRGIMSRLIDTRVDRWMSWDYLSDTTSKIKSSVLDLATPQKAKFSESFEEAMIRLELTEKDLINRKKEFTRLFYLFTLIGLFIIGYAVYMAYLGHFGACLISFGLAGFSFTQAFKWHFWLFQLRNRKLGCSVKEWLDGKVVDAHGTDITLKPNNNNKDLSDKEP